MSDGERVNYSSSDCWWGVLKRYRKLSKPWLFYFLVLNKGGVNCGWVINDGIQKREVITKTVKGPSGFSKINMIVTKKKRKVYG